MLNRPPLISPPYEEIQKIGRFYGFLSFPTRMNKQDYEKSIDYYTSWANASEAQATRFRGVVGPYNYTSWTWDSLEICSGFSNSKKKVKTKCAIELN